MLLKRMYVVLHVAKRVLITKLPLHITSLYPDKLPVSLTVNRRIRTIIPSLSIAVPVSYTHLTLPTNREV